YSLHNFGIPLAIHSFPTRRSSDLYFLMATITHIASLTVSSPAFKDKAPIPSKYTCEGADINPPVEIGNIPEGTQSLVLIIEDPEDRKSTRLNSSHVKISYAVFCLK